MRLTNIVSAIILLLTLTINLYASDQSVIKKTVDGEVVLKLKYAEVIVRLEQKLKPTEVYQNFMGENKIESNKIEMVSSFPITRGTLKVKNSDKAHIIVLRSTTLSEEELLELAEDIEGAEYVELAQPIQLNQTLPNDSRFNELWGMDNDGSNGGVADADIDAPEAWDIQRGSANVVVGVIDTGVDYTHPDLVNNMWKNPGEIAGNGIDDDGNGYVDDIYGIDTINHDSDPMDDNHHGTHCAGTIGGEGNNSLGVTGVNWTTSLAACKFLSSGGSGSIAGAIECVEYFNTLKANHGINVKVTNNSWGGGGFSQAGKDAIDASGALDILFVAAAGNVGSNNNDDNPHYPSSYTSANVIAVASTDRTDRKSSFSSYGLVSVDLAAPGSAILSTVIGGGYASFNGTSMATPHVAGAVALLAAQDSSKTALELKEQILNTVDVLEDLNGSVATSGRLNINNMLGGVTPPPVEGDINFDDIDTGGSYVSIPADYKGFIWSESFVAVDGMAYDSNSGYAKGIISTPNVAANANEDDVTLSNDEVFNFTSAYLTAAWNNDLEVTLKGYKDGTELYTRTVVVSPHSATKFDFNFEGVDTVTFHSEGGTNAGLVVNRENAQEIESEGLVSKLIKTNENKILGSGTHFTLDNIVINTEEEPPPPVEGEINFDDIDTGGSLIPVPDNYKELIWSSDFYITNGGTRLPDTGYENGMVSTPNTAFNAGGNDVTLSNSESFNFTSGYLTAAWNNDLEITLKGYKDGTELYTRTVVVSPHSATKFDFNFNGVDTVTFHAEGGTNAGLVVSDEVVAQSNTQSMSIITKGNKTLGSGTHFVLDNVVLGDDETPPPVEGDEINFDDIDTGGSLIPVPYNYKELIWSSDFYITNGGTRLPDTGYENGMVSTPNTAFNANGYDVTLSKSEPFNFTSGYLTAAWRNDLEITLKGYNNGVELYTRTVVVGPYSATKFDFNFNDVDTVTFHAEGGTNAGLVVSDEVVAQSNAQSMSIITKGNKTLGSGTHFVLDNVIIGGSSTPEIPSVENDLNGDGYSDLLIENTNNYRLNGWFGSENAEVSNQYLKTLSLEREPIAQADINGDGYLDILVLNTSNNALAMLKGSASGAVENIYLKQLSSDQSVIDIADMNGDGFDDIIIKNINNARVNALLGSEQGTLTNKYLKTLSDSQEIVGFMDVNGDGYQDIIVKNNTNRRVNAWISDANANVQNKYLKTLSDTVEIVNGVDFNNDGYEDIIVQNSNNGRVNAWISDANANMTNQYIKTLSSELIIAGTADINGDGFPEVIVSNSLNNRVSAWMNNAGVTVSTQYLNTLSTGAVLMVDENDMNGDSYHDLIVVNPNKRVSAWLGSSNGSVTNQYLKTLGGDQNILTP
ncbi:MAG: Unknown protein [uncultured Sulfurovum sp.]|uniref:Peptidase S8/S53 domain-containing protein n=1 Tax=uncultured Sulfurovum sp. TaxID=269237 RepID=A0A6S6TLM6_9BACT|nr:MAG: Unknown protein [uncultured Sulfurovum sp.]